MRAPRWGITVGKPVLSENAVPKIVSCLPGYLSKTTPKPRNKIKGMESGETTSNKKSQNKLRGDTLEVSTGYLHRRSSKRCNHLTGAAGPFGVFSSSEQSLQMLDYQLPYRF